MDSNKHNGRIPQLRFPGFEGEWEEKTLADICNITAGGDAPKQNFSKVKTGIYNVPVISNGIGENAIYGYTDIPKITQSAVTVAARGTIGYAEYRDYPYYPIIRLLSVIAKDSTIDTKYLSYLLSVQKYHSTDGGIPQLTVPMIGSTIIPIPSLLEQRTIAECLEAIDQMISAQNQKVESLKAHKKGLMQQLFPQPGATTPALRFPGFTGKWQEKKLNKVFSRVTRKNAENNQNVLTISAQYGRISQLEFFKKSVASSDVTGYYLLHRGEFAYNKSSSQGRPVGAIKPLRLYDKGVVSTLYICFKCNNPEEIDFWEQYFDAGILDSEILSIAQEGARNHGLLNISTGDFFGLNVILPTPPEMKKIAECLSSFDDVITAAENELDSLKAHKKGLMQQLFPQLQK